MLPTAFLMQIHEHRMTYNYQKNIYLCTFLILINHEKVKSSRIKNQIAMPSSWTISIFPFSCIPFLTLEKISPFGRYYCLALFYSTGSIEPCLSCGKMGSFSFCLFPNWGGHSHNFLGFQSGTIPKKLAINASVQSPRNYAI